MSNGYFSKIESFSCIISITSEILGKAILDKMKYRKLRDKNNQKSWGINVVKSN